jgi:hypothetical protein
MDLSEIVAALGDLTRDTFNGWTVFVAPGPDAYSVAQGVADWQPGAMEAQAPDYVMLGIDFSLRPPHPLARPIAAALGPALGDVRLPPPARAVPLDRARAVPLDRALAVLLDSDEVVPLSLAIALLLNFLATQVSAESVDGMFLSPFARLTFAEKAGVLERLEDPAPELVARIAAETPEAIRPAIAGQLAYVGGVLFVLPAIATYIDWLAFDRRTKTMLNHPTSWRLTGFQPDGPVEGWDDHQGYYQDRQRLES